MGLFNTGIIGDVVGGVFGIIDDLHTSDEEKAAMKFRITKLAREADLAQLAVNKEEAKSGRLFVSGWRPFVGWVCGFALAWTFVLDRVIQSIAFYLAEFMEIDLDLTGLPVFDLGTLMPVLLGMLGLGTLRTYEKVQGVTRNDMGPTGSSEARTERSD